MVSSTIDDVLIGSAQYCLPRVTPFKRISKTSHVWRRSWWRMQVTYFAEAGDGLEQLQVQELDRPVQSLELNYTPTH